MQISEVMHQGLITVDINDSVKKVAAIMKEEDVGALSVMDEGKLVGFVTDRDIVISCVAEGHSLDEPISNVMSEDVITIEKDRQLTDASKIMQVNNVSRILVTDNEKPIGIISIQDISYEMLN